MKIRSKLVFAALALSWPLYAPLAHGEMTKNTKETDQQLADRCRKRCDAEHLKCFEDGVKTQDQCNALHSLCRGQCDSVAPPR